MTTWRPRSSTSVPLSRLVPGAAAKTPTQRGLIPPAKHLIKEAAVGWIFMPANADARKRNGMGKEKINIQHHQHHWPIPQWMTAEVIQRQITTNSTHSKEHRWRYCGEWHNVNASTVRQSCKEIKRQKQDNPTLSQLPQLPLRTPSRLLTVLFSSQSHHKPTHKTSKGPVCQI